MINIKIKNVTLRDKVAIKRNKISIVRYEMYMKISDLKMLNKFVIVFLDGYKNNNNEFYINKTNNSN